MRNRKSRQPVSLWEVVNKDKLRQSQEKVLSQMARQKQQNGQPAPSEAPKPVEFGASKKAGTKKIGKAKIRYNFNLSLSPKVLTITAFVVVVALVLIFSTGNGDKSASVALDDARQPGVVQVERANPELALPFQTVKVEKVLPKIANEDDNKSYADKTKNHVIIVTVYQVKRDLEPVKLFFAKNGIATDIVKPAGSKFYYLITKKKYESPLRKNTDGHYALLNIKRIGAKYDAPSGYEPFGKNPFQDAYGVNFYKSELFK